MRPFEVARKIKVMTDGEFLEIPCPLKVGNFRTAVTMCCGRAHFAVRRSPDGTILRFYRTGTWGILGDNKSTRKAVQAARAIPILWNNLPQRIADHAPVLSLGFLGGSSGSILHRKQSKKLVRLCTFKGCPFPRIIHNKFCERHKLFETTSAFMDDAVDLHDIFPTEDNQWPTLSNIRLWEMDVPAVFEYRGIRKRDDF